MPNAGLVVAVSVLLIGLGTNGVRTGLITGRIGNVIRAKNPAWFGVRVVLYEVLGMLGLCYVRPRGF
jgi:hypothetical protein